MTGHRETAGRKSTRGQAQGPASSGIRGPPSIKDGADTQEPLLTLALGREAVAGAHVTIIRANV